MKENFNVRDKKGSIALFVLVGLLFMSGFLIILYGYNVNKSKIAKEQFNSISDIYSHKDGNVNAYDRAYTALRKKNKQTLTKTVENTSTLELERTYEENLVNYRIYGTAEGVGDRVNLLNNRNLLLTTNNDEKWEITETGIRQSKMYTGGYQARILYNITDILEPNTTYYVHTDILRNYESINSTSNSISGSFRVYIDDVSVQILFADNKTVNGSFITPTTFSNAYIKTYTVVNDTIIKDFDNTKTYYWEWQNIYISKTEYTEYFPYNTFKIPLKVLKENGEEVRTVIYLNTPLKDDEYIDFKTRKVIRIDGTEESLKLPEILAYEDYTKIEVLTDGIPSKIEVEYIGYTFE